VPGSPKMGYKASFTGLEVFSENTWNPMRDPAKFEPTLHPLSTAPIAEQVANISLPDGNKAVSE
jgi:hypothetical protein